MYGIVVHMVVWKLVIMYKPWWKYRNNEDGRYSSTDSLGK